MLFLHLEDNPHDAELVGALIGRQWPNSRILRVDTSNAFQSALSTENPALVLSDFSLPSFDGLSALAYARQVRPDVPFIFLSGTIGEEVAVEALKNGAIDYVLKDRMGRLIPAIQRALEQASEQQRRHRAESELRDAQERFRQITENVADMIAVFDLQGRRTYSNPAYLSLFGQVSDEAEADGFALIHPDDRERVRSSFFATVETGVGRRTEYRTSAGGAGMRFIESQDSVIRGSDGTVRNVLIVARDVTARRNAEERIQQQASLLDKARDAICVTDLSNRITYWNASAEQLFGWSVLDVVGKDVSTILFQADLIRYQDALKQLRGEGRWEGELRPQTREGRAVVVESRWTLVTDEVGQPQSILFISTDITEKKRLEVQFLRAQRMESIGTLAGGIAHDLNNVLTPILVAAQVLRSEAKEDDRVMLETIEKSALHGAALVKQVLLFARGAEGDHAPLQFRHLVSEMEKLLRETLPRSIEIRTNVPRDLWLVKGDATQLNQVLMNLCVNARDALTGGGHIEISAKNYRGTDEFWKSHPEVKRGPLVIVAVADNGCGIAPAVIDRIWDPFFTTKEIGKGTGLGLSTVLGIVKGHGGTVSVSSREGRGTRFEIFLPALATELSATPPVERGQLARGGGEGVLVIDDEPYIRDVIGSMLRYCGYKSFFASDGLSGLDAYQRHRAEIHLVLVDMMMPGIDGAETMRLLRDLNPELPLLAMSGMLEGVPFGSDPVLRGIRLLRKPITAETLLGTIAETLRSSNAPPAAKG